MTVWTHILSICFFPNNSHLHDFLPSLWSSSRSVASVALYFFPRVAVCCGNVRLFLSGCCCFFFSCKSENKRLLQRIGWKDAEESLLTQKSTTWGETESTDVINPFPPLGVTAALCPLTKPLLTAVNNFLSTQTPNKYTVFSQCIFLRFSYPSCLLWWKLLSFGNMRSIRF